MNETLQQPYPADLDPERFEALPRAQAPPLKGLSLEGLLARLFAERRLILYCGLGAFVLSAMFAFLLPNIYTASASFVPPGSNSSTAASALLGQLSALGAGGALVGKGQGDLYVGVLKSRTIARAVIERFGLMQVYKVKKFSQAEKRLEKNSFFSMGSKDPIVTVSVADKSPERARDLANGYLEALQNATNELALTESSQRRLFYEKRLAKEKDDLANAEVALKQVEERTGLIAPAGQTSSEIQTLAQLQGQITAREVRLASLLHDETEENPDVIRLRKEVTNLQGQVAELEEGQNKGQFGHFSTSQVPALELEYIRRSRDVKYHETLFDIIARQYEAARIDEAKDSALQILDRATVPDTRSGPQRSLVMVLGLLVGLVGGSAWVLVRGSRPALES